MIHFSETRNGPPRCGAKWNEDDVVRCIGEANLKMGDMVCTACLGLYEPSVPVWKVLQAGTLTVTPKGMRADQG